MEAEMQLVKHLKRGYNFDVLSGFQIEKFWSEMKLNANSPQFLSHLSAS